MTRLANKTAIITGAAGGIGTAISELFLKNGCNVFLVDLMEDSLKEMCDILDSSRVGYLAGDISNFETNQQAVAAAVQQFEHVDVFIANAGIGGMMQSLIEYDETVFTQVMQVNLFGVWHGIRAVGPHMIQQGKGSIVITSSVAGLGGAPLLGAYCASKHAVVGLMRVAAREFARFNIRVNTVNPGPTETDMVRGLELGFSPHSAEEGKKLIESNIPLSRYGEPSEIADLMLFLASDDSSYITGATHTIDGGSRA